MAKCLYTQQSLSVGVEGFNTVSTRYGRNEYGMQVDAILDTMKAVGLPIAKHSDLISWNKGHKGKYKPLLINRDRIRYNRPAIVLVEWIENPKAEHTGDTGLRHATVVADTTSVGTVVFLDPEFGLYERWDNGGYRPDQAHWGFFRDVIYTG